MKARGVEQRNAGLEWLRKNLNEEYQLNGVVFFMDDDNTYSLQIFEEVFTIASLNICVSARNVQLKHWKM